MKSVLALIVVTTSAVLAAAVPNIAFAQAGESSGAVVIVVRATTGCFSDTLRVSGIVVPRSMAIVNVADEGYKITDVSVSEGSEVTAGQTLAQLTRSSSQPSGQTQQQSAGQAGGAQRTAPTSLTLRAPAKGLITKSTAKVGAMASPQGEPLFNLLINNELELQVEVPSVHIPKLEAGGTARVSIDGGVELPGRVRLVAPDIDEKTQLGRARIALGSDPSLRIGMFGRAAIDASRSCGVMIPRSAVDYQTGGTTVQVVRGQTVETRRVVVGLLSEDGAEIRDGVKEGDTVVAHAGTSLHDGDKVKPIVMGDVELSRGIK